MTGRGPDIPAAAEAWMAEDPDASTRDELAELLARDDEAAGAELADRFSGRLRFGTAGLRGVVAAGPNRMNRAVVRTATAALAAWLAERRPGSPDRGVVVGCDARHGSTQFADEVARVLVGAGFRVHLLERARPTPLLAFAVRHLHAAAGVMITASHNPAADNGYKLYLEDGAQIIPPVDAEIEAAMEAVGPLSGVPTGSLTDPLTVRPGAELEQAYLAALTRGAPAPRGGRPLRIVYTPLHGVALGLFRAALDRAGYPEPVVVAAQAQPDPDFPTVPFPNPEEPGALDLALAEARRAHADLLIANDPDGDRLAVAVPDRTADDGWRVLTGDQVGALLGAYVLDRSASEPDPGSRLVASTIVSSSLLGKIAAAAGARYAETLTGFKWIARAGDAVSGSRYLFGYEEALGYSVGSIVRDKDGLGAALAFLGLCATALAEGQAVLDGLDGLERRHGVHLTSQLSIRSTGPAATMVALRADPPQAIGGQAIRRVVDLSQSDPTGSGLPSTDLLIYHLDGARLSLRPSGTEPKLKIYLEVVRAVTDGDLTAARALAGAEMESLRHGIAAVIGV